MRKSILRIIMIIAAIILITAGIITGGFKDVYNRAAMICYECIGIG